ncbi:MAG: (d)CMP kinase [Phycisphaerae bacterium]|nr:(d)CMP kinase [Phycisphaerae bacterium]
MPLNSGQSPDQFADQFSDVNSGSTSLSDSSDRPFELMEVIEISRSEIEHISDMERVVCDRDGALATLDRAPQFDDRPMPTLPRDQSIVITIDGPAGTGKSSVARTLAKALGLDFLDTGAMYRAAAALAIDNGISPTDIEGVVRETTKADLHFDWSKDPPTILAFGKPIDHRIRASDVAEIVSPIATIKSLREHMVRKQRIIAQQHPRLVTEGRDQGSIVFPDAVVKFYLDASPDVRARRRAEQLMAAGHCADLGAITAEILDRDKRDSSRADGPLICPKDAICVDTSDLAFDQVVKTLHRHVLAVVGR